MRAISEEIAVLQHCKQVRLVLVQFGSPFGPDKPELEFQKDIKGSRFEWKEKTAVEKRCRRFNEVLHAITQEGLLEVKPPIIVFPEYTVPKQAHSIIQEFADANGTIVIPGTYYDTEEGPLKKNNVCKIYLPGQDPLAIVKRFGFSTEADALMVSEQAANIAHLAGRNDVLGEFSISVFICRDYLMPFRVEGDSPPTMMTDWRKPGVNIVVMNSSQTKEFEAEAGFEARELRGRRRVVALCNCAGVGVEQSASKGSAIVGAKADMHHHPGDVIESLPGSDEGVLVADIALDMTDLAVTLKRPGTSFVSPVRQTSTFIIRSPRAHNEALPIQLEAKKGTRPTVRGVFHPAFLEVAQRNIALELFRTRQLERARRALAQRAIASVSAFVVDGMHDLLIRYYQAADPNLKLTGSPYLQLSREKFEHLFSAEQHVKIKIEPKAILKYRTIRIPRNAFEASEWNKRCSQIKDLIPMRADLARRHAILQKIVQLSEDWDDPSISASDKEMLAPIFLDEPEIVPSISGYTTGRTTSRRRYVLISEPGANEARRAEFETAVIFDYLMNLPEVRSIYRIEIDIDHANFDYWVDMFGEPWKLYEIVHSISQRAFHLNMDVGTRTIEVQDHLLFESVQGIFSSDLGTEVSEFLEETRSLDPDIQVEVTDEQWHKAGPLSHVCGRCWASQVDAWYGTWNAAEHRRYRNTITSFYGYFFWGNLAPDDNKSEEYLKRARNAWSDLYQWVERKYKQFLKKHLDVVTDQEMWRKSLDVLRASGVPENDLAKLPVSSIDRGLHVMQVDEKVLSLGTIDWRAIKRNYKEHISLFRNRMLHDDDGVFVLSILRPRDDGQRRWTAEEIGTITAELIGLMNLAETCLKGLEGHVT